MKTKQHNVASLHRLFLLIHVHKSKMQGRLGMVTHAPTCPNTAFLLSECFTASRTNINITTCHCSGHLAGESAASERIQALHAGRVGRPERSPMTNQVSLRIMTWAAESATPQK